MEKMTAQNTPKQVRGCEDLFVFFLFVFSKNGVSHPDCAEVASFTLVRRREWTEGVL